MFTENIQNWSQYFKYYIHKKQQGCRLESRVETDLKIILSFEQVYLATWVVPRLEKISVRIKQYLEYQHLQISTQIFLNVILSVNVTSIGNSENERHYNRETSVVCKKDNQARMVLVRGCETGEAHASPEFRDFTTEKYLAS